MLGGRLIYIKRPFWVKSGTILNCTLLKRKFERKKVLLISYLFPFYGLYYYLAQNIYQSNYHILHTSDLINNAIRPVDANWAMGDLGECVSLNL